MPVFSASGIGPDCSAPRRVAALRWRVSRGGWRLQHASAGIAAIVGYEPARLLKGDPCWTAIVEGADVFGAVEGSASDASSLTLRHAVRCADGDLRRVLEEIEIIRDARGRPIEFTSVVFDVADVAGRGDGIGVLAYVSHEVRTPLTGILGLTETLSQSSLSDEQRQMVQALSDAGVALMQMVNNMLDLSRLQAGASRLVETDFRLGELCGSVAELFRRGLPPGGPRIVVSGQCFDILLSGDAPKLRQILSNLVMNAVKFTPKGEIEIGWRCEPPAADGGIVARLFVRDTGVGMDAATVGRLFVPYAQADLGAAAGGAGLGLSISRALADMIGGRLWCESAPGRGSTFHLDVALREATQPEVARDERSMADLRHRIAAAAPRLLVADDTGANQHLLRLLLSPLNVRLQFVGDGEAAVRHAVEGCYDAVLMDNRMPRMTGPEATAEIRRLERRRGRAHTPIIGLSADSEALCLDAFRRAGADDYVAKPFSASRLLGALDGAIRITAMRRSSPCAQATGS